MVRQSHVDPAMAGVHLRVAGRCLAPVLAGGDSLGFALDAPIGDVWLCAPAFCPAQLGDSGDDRRLGFAVTAIAVLAGGERRIEIPITHPALSQGFHPAEPGGWRWTEGAARLPAHLFAGVRGRMLLVLRGFGRAGAPVGRQMPPRPGAAVFLAGDSYPTDAYVETNLFAAMHPFLASGRIGQAAMLATEGAPPPERDIAARMRRLDRMLRAAPGMPVLFGRSSGARVATRYAAGHRVGAVVCLGYPFRAPDRAPEAERVAHLAELDTPTLIIQGRDDAYGGVDTVRATALSPAVTVEFIEGGHEFHLDAAGWARLARRILVFLAGCRAGDGEGRTSKKDKRKEVVLF